MDTDEIAQHLLSERDYYRTHIVEFCKVILGFEPDEQQTLVLEAVQNNPRVAVKSGHGTGKTACASVILLWFLFCYGSSKVITTAPTWRQVKEVLWNEIHKWAANCFWFKDYQVNFLETKLGFNNDWFAIGVSSNKPDNLQGFHAENILYIIDEANGVDESIFGAIEGTLTTNAKMLMISNPVNPIGYFYDAFSKHKDFWKTITLSCMKSKFVLPSWIEDRKKEWGEDSPIYQARVLGEFPEEGEDILIPLRWVERAIGTNVEGFAVPLHSSDSVMQIGADIARFGSNYSVIVTIEYQDKSDVIVVRDVSSHSKKDEFFTAGRIIQMDDKWHVNKLQVDDAGLGGGVTTYLKHSHLTNKVVPINFGSASNDEKFLNLKAQMFWYMRTLFEQNRVVFATGISDKDLNRFLSQLPQLRYEFTQNQKIKMTDKSDMTDDVTDSPDWADALAIALWRVNREKIAFSMNS